MLENGSKNYSETGIVNSWESFFAYLTLGSMINDGVFVERLPNSILLSRALDTSIQNVSEAVQRLENDGVVDTSGVYFAGQSAGLIKPGRVPYNHRLSGSIDS